LAVFPHLPMRLAVGLLPPPVWPVFPHLRCLLPLDYFRRRFGLYFLIFRCVLPLDYFRRGLACIPHLPMPLASELIVLSRRCLDRCIDVLHNFFSYAIGFCSYLSLGGPMVA
jgi:dolichol kinase